MKSGDIDGLITCSSEGFVPHCNQARLSDKEGFWRAYKPFTINEVHEHLEVFLNSLHINLEEKTHLEPYWVSIHPEDDERYFPSGKVVCAVSSGNNEGAILFVQVKDNDGNIHPLFSAKYFFSTAIVGLIAAKTQDAFELGCSYQESLVDATIHSSETTPYQLAEKEGKL